MGRPKSKKPQVKFLGCRVTQDVVDRVQDVLDVVNIGASDWIRPLIMSGLKEYEKEYGLNVKEPVKPCAPEKEKKLTYQELIKKRE